eukprot:351773-Chlamydomonas_euryale.AAC.17
MAFHAVDTGSSGGSAGSGGGSGSGKLDGQAALVEQVSGAHASVMVSCFCTFHMLASVCLHALPTNAAVYRKRNHSAGRKCVALHISLRLRGSHRPVDCACARAGLLHAQGWQTQGHAAELSSCRSAGLFSPIVAMHGRRAPG